MPPSGPRELRPPAPPLQVESWNPLTDTVPIHSWVHPWLPLMQARLEPLYSPIRSKLASALQKWHPRDSSAKLILQPWKDVFTPGSWEAFMVKNIVPKLGKEPGKPTRSTATSSADFSPERCSSVPRARVYLGLSASPGSASACLLSSGLGLW